MTVGRFEEGKRLDLALEFSARSGIRGVVIGAMEGKSYLKADMGSFVRCSLGVKAKSNNCCSCNTYRKGRKSLRPT